MTTFQPLTKDLWASAPKSNILTTSIIVACITPLLAMGSAQATNGATASNSEAVSGQRLTADNLYKCAELRLDAARLACFDKLLVGEEVTLGREKAPLDLAETFRALISDRRPTAVFATEEEKAQAESSGYVTGAVTAEGNERLARAGLTIEDVAPYTAMSLAYDLDKNSEKGVWRVRPHNTIYLMPAFAHFNPNRTPSTPTQPVPDAKDYEDQYDPLELKAQISLKTKIAEDVFDTNADVWFGYTQQMHWQVYNKEHSRPFRATDYMPEVFITQPVKANLPLNGRLRMLGAGAIHHSNGQSDPLSRSWNRIYLMGGAEWGKFSVIPKVWYHVDDNGSRRGDNPDIKDYYGHGEIQAMYDFGKGETLSATGRYNMATNKGAIQFDYTHPITRDLHAFIQIFHGYGESLIDYNENTTAVGVGLSLTDWKGL